MPKAPWLQELDVAVGLLATVTALWSLGAAAQGSLSCCLLFALNAAIAHQAWQDYARRIALDRDDDELATTAAAHAPAAPRMDGARLRIDGAWPIAAVSADLLHGAGLARAGVLDVAQAAGFARFADASPELRRLMDLCRQEGRYRGGEFAQFYAGQRELAQDEAVILAMLASADPPTVVCFIGKRT